MRAALALLLLLAATPAQAATGEALFNDQCADCHTVAPASSTDTAPTLKGVMGRKIASVPGFQYSDALKAKSGGVWTDATLNAFLADPKAFAPGTAMSVSVPAAADRQAIIDYLKTVP